MKRRDLALRLLGPKLHICHQTVARYNDLIQCHLVETRNVMVCYILRRDPFRRSQGGCVFDLALVACYLGINVDLRTVQIRRSFQLEVPIFAIVYRCQVECFNGEPLKLEQPLRIFRRTHQVDNGFAFRILAHHE